MAVPLLRLRPFGRPAVSEFVDELINRGVNELACLFLADTWQILSRDLSWLAAVPVVTLLRFGVGAEGNNLLAVAKEFDFLGAPVRGDNAGDDLAERLIGAEGNCALGRFANPH